MVVTEITKKSNTVITEITWDWKERPTLKDLRAALNPLGIRVFNDPQCENSDTIGFIFTVDDVPERAIQDYVNENGNIKGFNI